MADQLTDNPIGLDSAGGKIYGFGGNPSLGAGQYITTDQLKPAPTINLPSSLPEFNYGGAVSGANASINGLDSITASITPAETEADRQNKSLFDDLLQITNSLNNKSKDLYSAQVEAGVPELRKQQALYSGLVTKGTAEYNALVAKENADMAKAEATSRSAFDYAGTSGAIQRQALAEKALKTSEITMNAALANAAAGNLTVALRLASDANDAKYAPLENLYKLKELQQKALKETVLDKQEKIQLKAAEEKLKQDQAKLDEQKANQKAISEMVINASAQGASADIVDLASKTKTPLEAAKILGKYSGDYLKYELLKEQIKTERAQQEKIYNDIKNTQPIKPGEIPVEYQGALNVILGSDKFTKEQKASITNAVKSGQNPFSVIKNQAKNIMGQTTATKLDNYETAKSQLMAVDDALKQYYINGGKTNIFTGNIEKVINKLGEVKDPKLVEIATQIQSSLQIYRNAVSGTAYSVQEGRDIASIFPGINKTEGLNRAILDGRMKAFDTTIDSTYKNVLGSSYDQIKNVEAASSPNNPFTQSLGGFNSTINGSSIIGGFNSNGTFNFVIPK